MQEITLRQLVAKQPVAFYSRKKCARQGKILVKMLHGAKILGKSSDFGKVSKKSEPMLKKAELFSKQGIAWHHHMLFPGCMYNRRRGKWCMMFEAKGEKASIFFNSEPRESLRKFELLFYSQEA